MLDKKFDTFEEIFRFGMLCCIAIVLVAYVLNPIVTNTVSQLSGYSALLLPLIDGFFFMAVFLRLTSKDTKSDDF